MIYDSLITQIKNIPPADLAARGVIAPAKTNANGEKTYICPACNNGTGKSGDGIAFKHIGGAWLAKCFKCGRGFDNISLFAFHYGLDTRADFTEILKRAANDFGIATDLQFSASKSFSGYHNLTPLKIEKAAPPVKPLAQDSKSLEVEKLTAKYILQLLALPDRLENLPIKDRRGLPIETLRYFNCIYVEKWLHPKIFAEYKFGLRDKSKLPPRSRRLIIPTADGLHYNAVLLNSDRPKFPSNKWKMHAGKISLFGIETIHGAGIPPLETVANAKFFLDKYDSLSPAEKQQYLEKNFKYLELALCAMNEVSISAVKIVYVFEGEINAMSEWQQYQELAFLRYTVDIFGGGKVYQITNDDTDGEDTDNEDVSGIETENLNLTAEIKEQGELVSQGALCRKAFIATCSASNKSWIEPVDEKCKELNIRPIFIIRFDNDKAGKDNAEYAKAELMKRGYPAKISLYDGGNNDK